MITRVLHLLQLAGLKKANCCLPFQTLQQFTHMVSPADISRQFAKGKKAANTLCEERIGHMLKTIITLGLLRKTEEGLFVM